jgi:hypothetical protein
MNSAMTGWDQLLLMLRQAELWEFASTEFYGSDAIMPGSWDDAFDAEATGSCHLLG